MIESLQGVRGVGRLAGLLLAAAAISGCDLRREPDAPPVLADRGAATESASATGAPLPAPRPADSAAGPRLARALIDCIARQYPSAGAAPIESAADLAEPRVLHPAFHGCGDPATAVDAHRALARLLRTGAAGPFAAEARATLDERLAAAPLKVEAASFGRAGSATLAAALLALDAELRSGGDAMRGWQQALAPLAGEAAVHLDRAFARIPVPDRGPTRANSADQLLRWLDRAEVAGDAAMAERVRGHAGRLFAADADCPLGYEPTAGATLSPCLAEAVLMARLWPAERWRGWFDALLPGWADAGAALDWALPVTLARTESLPDPARFDTLLLARARLLTALARRVGPDDPRHAPLLAAAAAHRRTGREALRDGMPAELAVEAVLAMGGGGQGAPAPRPPALSPVDRPTASAAPAEQTLSR